MGPTAAMEYAESVPASNPLTRYYKANAIKAVGTLQSMEGLAKGLWRASVPGQAIAGDWAGFQEMSTGAPQLRAVAGGMAAIPDTLDTAGAAPINRAMLWGHTLTGESQSGRSFKDDAIADLQGQQAAAYVATLLMPTPKTTAPPAMANEAQALAVRGNYAVKIAPAAEVAPGVAARYRSTDVGRVGLTAVGMAGRTRDGGDDGPRFSEGTREHMLEGDPGDPGSGHGPNRGSREGAFPDTWTDDQAVGASERVAASPLSTWKRQYGSHAESAEIHAGGPAPGEAQTTASGRPMRYRVRGQDHGLDLELIVEKAPGEQGLIITSYVRY